jgi:mannitol/fructose-specific phosphotransferase system IIA component (Ntr-type)
MPYRTLDLAAAADYLHVTRNELEQLVKTTEIPHQDRGGRIVFLRGELDAWASQRIMGLPPKRLAAYHQKSTQGTRAILAHEALLPDLLQPNFIAAAMTSKTKKSVIRDLVALAEATGRVMDPTDFLASVEAREQLCSTGLPGGLAILHCRNLQPYRFEDSFIVVGRTLQEIHFGAPDGRPTWLFFLICCQDERIHLHTLARLCLIMQKTAVVSSLLAAPDAATIYAELLAAEQSALAHNNPPANPAAVVT